MKKIIILAAAVSFLTVLPSCKKDYVCKCTKTYTGNNTTVTTNDGNYTYKDTRVRAEERCDDNDKTGSDIGGDYTRNCDIQ